jgi:integrase
MGVKQVLDNNGGPLLKDGKLVFTITHNKRSKVDPTIRESVDRVFVGTQIQAEKEYKKATEEVRRAIWEREQQGCSWGKLVEKFGYAYEMEIGFDQPVSKATAIDTTKGLERHTQYWWKRPASDISIVDVKTLLLDLESQGMSKSRRRAIKSYISVAWGWGKENGFIKGNPPNPTSGAKVGRSSKKGQERMPDILTLTEIRKLIDLATVHNHPWRDIWAMALLTGMRSGELYALEWSDVNMESRLISVTKTLNVRFKSITTTKGGYWRSVPINGDLEGLLAELRVKAQNRPVDERKFILPRSKDWMRGNQARILRGFCVAVGLPSVKFHALRACFATQLLQSGVTAPTVMSICGWKDYETMMIYIRLAGIETKGATDKLKFITPAAAMAHVVPLFGQRDEL